MECVAQTNIIFPQLISSTNTVLMTNAEFRCFGGDKIFFLNENGYQSFYAADLSTNVLSALHVTAAQLAARKKAQDEYDANYQSKVAAARADEARKQYAKDHPVSGIYHDSSSTVYDPNQQGGNFMGQ